MAYLDFTQFAAGPAVEVTALSALSQPKAEQADFDHTEWAVVHLAKRDGLSTLREPGWVDRLIALVFGERPNPRLANARLEALRQLAVDAWHHGYTVSPSALKAFRAAGFSLAQLETLLGAISAGRIIRKRRGFA